MVVKLFFVLEQRVGIYEAHRNATELRGDAARESYRWTKLATLQRKQGYLHFNETFAWASAPAPAVTWLEPRFKFSRDLSPARHCAAAIEVLSSESKRQSKLEKT